MRSRMPPSLWIVSIAAYGLLAFGLYIFPKTQVAPCIGGVGPEGLEMQRRCAEQWFANRPIIDKLIDTPIPAVALFVSLVLVTAWLTRRRDGAPSQAVRA